MVSEDRDPSPYGFGMTDGRAASVSRALHAVHSAYATGRCAVFRPAVPTNGGEDPGAAIGQVGISNGANRSRGVPRTRSLTATGSG
jgi:hypothetical protein